MYLTIDVRMLCVLAFTGIFVSNYGIIEYFMLMILGVLYYRIIYLFLIKYEPSGYINVTETVIDSSKALGFLPSIASGLAIYAFYRIVNYNNHPLLLQDFYDSCSVIYAVAAEDPLMLVLMFIPFILIWIFLEFKRHRAKKKNQIMIPMLGDGDVYVMAVWLAVLGIADMTIVLFISAIVQVLVLTYRDKIQNKISIGR